MKKPSKEEAPKEDKHLSKEAEKKLRKFKKPIETDEYEEYYDEES